MFETVSRKPSFPQLEEELITWWREKEVFQKSLRQRQGQETKAFYDGPITANGKAHHGHMLTFALKDIFPRYWTMKGYYVPRSLGWDCQGIPVEYEVEKRLGFQEKRDIEKYGVAEFNQLCRQSVLEHKQEILELEERIGRWTDESEEYATMDASYIESVWWSLAELYKKNLLYEGFKVVPFSTRAGTTLSNAEVALGGYKPYTDPAVTVKFPLHERSESILAWTTTPWTLPTNFALAVGEQIWYASVRLSSGEEYIVAEDLVDTAFAEYDYQIQETLPGSDLLGLTYQPLFDFFRERENCFQIYAGDHVTTDSGTGIVHLAPYGAEDNEIFHQVGIESIDVLNDQGDFTQEVPPYQGMFYRKANDQIITDLTENGRLFKHEEYTHDMPMCWRTDTPLIYKPITSWYIAMSRLRAELQVNNQDVSWIPKHIKEGRFGNWLAEIKDWGISRNRYWGTPLPIWRAPSGKVKVIGSFQELKELSGVSLEDPHRPYVDDITFEFEGETYSRVPDVIDVWYDSGAMPFARFHYPFSHQEVFKDKFPAEYIAEGLDQTRGWFYSLMAISTALFDETPYKNVLVNGMVLADDGQKLSKSKQNYEPPQQLFDQFGADAIRFNFFTTPISAGEDTIVSSSTLKIMTQEYLLPLWNMYSFLATYAKSHNWYPHESQIQKATPLWILSREKETIIQVNEYLDDYRIPQAMREIKSFMDDLSKWFIRTSRGEFSQGNSEYLYSLHRSLLTLLKLLAPFAPFVTEYLYQRLAIDDQPESIHLCDWPEVNQDIDSDLLRRMATVREIVEKGFQIRDRQEIKVRQPLARVGITGVELRDWMKDIIAREINVKQVTEEDIDGLSEEGQGYVVTLDTEITPELAEEGTVRDMIRNLQMMRKKQRLSVEQRIDLILDVSQELRVVIERHRQEITEPVGVEELRFANLEGQEGCQKAKINGEKIRGYIKVIE